MVKIFHKIKKKMTRSQKVFIFIFVCIFSIYLGLSYLNTNVNPIIISISEAKVRSLSVRAVNNAISAVIVDPAIYDNLITIEENAEGEVTLIQVNPIQINSLTKELALETQNNLEEMGETGINIPIGSFSGLPILNGLGPMIAIRLIPVGSINCNFTSEFNSAGINQTNHKIYVNIETKVSLVLPLAISYITTYSQMLICESIIVGDVPEVYLDTNNVENALNLVPD